MIKLKDPSYKKTILKDVKLLKPKRYFDERGFFEEIYNQNRYEQLGINFIFVQDNHSKSIHKQTLRGLHFQSFPKAQAKLISCIKGRIFDVAVDIRLGSPTYGKWVSYELSAENGYKLFIPIGFAHGFLTLQENSEIIYKCSDYYDPKSEGVLLWNDPNLGINWPKTKNITINQRDSSAPLLKNLNSPFTWDEKR